MEQKLRSPALDPQTVPARSGSSYPTPFRAAVEDREKRPLGDAAGLSQFGVNLVELPPGCWSSQRHWHTHEDAFVFLLDLDTRRRKPGCTAIRWYVSMKLVSVQEVYRWR